MRKHTQDGDDLAPHDLDHVYDTCRGCNQIGCEPNRPERFVLKILSERNMPTCVSNALFVLITAFLYELMSSVPALFPPAYAVLSQYASTAGRNSTTDLGPLCLNVVT